MTRLLSLVGRSECPPRPADELLAQWHEASGTSLAFAEWCDPTSRRLAATLCDPGEPRNVDAAVVAFAQARAGSDHTAEVVAADMVALLHLVEARADARAGKRTGNRADGPPSLDPVGLVARAVAAWATERVAAVSTASCIDPFTGLVNGGFLRARLRELHAQCEALSIMPSMAFGALVLRLDLELVPPISRLRARVGVGRTLMDFFRAGETVAAPTSDLLAAVMPAYALERAESDVQIVISQQAELSDVVVAIDRRLFGDDATDTWSSLMGTRVGA